MAHLAPQPPEPGPGQRPVLAAATRTGPRTVALGGMPAHGCLEALFRERGLEAVVSRIGSAFCTYFMDHVPLDWHDIALHHDFALDVRYRRALLDRGVLHFPLACKQGSISAAHTDADLAFTLEATREALASL